MPYQRQAEAVLAKWREVERALEATKRGSQEEEELQAEALQLRDENARLVDAAREHDRPEPPPWPGSRRKIYDR